MRFRSPNRIAESGAVIFGIAEEKNSPRLTERLDRDPGGAPDRAIAASRFTARRTSCCPLGAGERAVALIVLRVSAARCDRRAAGDIICAANVLAHLNHAGEKEGSVRRPLAGATLEPAELPPMSLRARCAAISSQVRPSRNRSRSRASSG